MCHLIGLFTILPTKQASIPIVLFSNLLTPAILLILLFPHSFCCCSIRVLYYPNPKYTVQRKEGRTGLLTINIVYVSGYVYKGMTRRWRENNMFELWVTHTFCLQMEYEHVVLVLQAARIPPVGVQSAPRTTLFGQVEPYSWGCRRFNYTRASYR